MKSEASTSRSDEIEIIKTKILPRNKNGFKFLPQVNRPIKSNQVRALSNAIAKMGVTRDIIVAKLPFIDKGLFIIDGQHLYTALVSMDSPIPYREIIIENVEDLIDRIATLNNTSKSWTMTDYIHSWSYIRDDYKKLQRYYQMYDFEYNNLAAYLSNKYKGGGNVTKSIKNGSFKVMDEEKNVGLLKDLTECLRVIPCDNRFKSRYVCAEYLKFRRLTDSYDHELFLMKLRETRKLYKFIHHEDEKLSDFFQQLI